MAIDALAINVLHEDERGTANGFMFAGASLGSARRLGSPVPHAVMPFKSTFLFVVAAILLVTVFVVLPLRRRRPLAAVRAARARAVGPDLDRSSRRVPRFRRLRAAFLGVFFALLPPGAYALISRSSRISRSSSGSMTRRSPLILWSTLIFAGLHRRRLALRSLRPALVARLFSSSPSLPRSSWRGHLQRGWIIRSTGRSRPAAAAAGRCSRSGPMLVYNGFNGLFYGIDRALHGHHHPAVAATQFTAYMAMANLSPRTAPCGRAARSSASATR